MVSTRSQRIPLKSLSALTLHANRRTTSRRFPPVPQLTCKGLLCRKYTPDVVQCVAVGTDGVGGLEWKCEADLPSGLRFGDVDVSCEGWDGPDDPNILRGSCGLTYSLVRASPALEDGYKSYLPGRSSSLVNDAFNLVFTLVTVYLVSSLLLRLFKFLYNRFFSGRSGPRPPTSRPPQSWGWGGGGGGGGGGSGGGGPRPPPSSGPPPPYTPKPDPSSPSGDAAGWRPGFWSGAALGWIANAFLGTGGGRNRPPPRTHPVYAEYDVFGRPTGLGPTGLGSGGGGFWGGALRGAQVRQPAGTMGGWGWGGRQAQRWRNDDDDRGVGTSASGGMRRSTGFGGTSVR